MPLPSRLRPLGAALFVLLLAAGCAGPGPAATDAPAPAPAQTASDDVIPRASYDVESFEYPELRSVQVPEVQRLDLENGMTIFLLEDHELPVISASARIDGGEVYVPDDHVGLASITGTVMRTGGTETMTSDEINQLLENLGATVETGMGSTSGSAFMNTLAENVDQVLPVFADVLRRPAFAEDKLEQAKTQAKSGIARRNDNPQQIAFREFQQIIYGEDSPYARVTQYYTVDAVSREDAVDFHRRYVQPEGIILSVWGDFDADAMAQTLRATFGDWEAPADYEAPTPPEPTATRERTVSFIPKDDVTQSTILIGHPGEVTRDNPDYFPLIVMNEVLSGGFTSRLFQKVRTELGLAYAVFGSYGAGYERPGLFQAGTFTKSASTVEATRVMLDEIERLRSAPPTDEEVALAKDAYLNSFVFNFDSRSEVLGRLMTYEYYGYPRDFLDQTRRQVQQVTPDDIYRVAQKYLHPDQAHILVLGKEEALDEPVTVLAEDGSVDRIDIRIPTAPPGEAAPAASAEEQAQGRSLFGEVRDALGGDALDDVETLRRTARNRAMTPQGEQTLETTITTDLSGRLYAETTMPGGIRLTIADDGQQMRMQTPQGTMDAPPAVRQEVTNEVRRDLVYLFAQPNTVDAADRGTETVEGTTYQVLQLTPSGADAPFTLYVDPDTKRPARMTYTAVGPGGAPAESVSVYTDFQTVDGVTVPFTTTVYRDGEQAAVSTTTDLVFNVAVDDATFMLE